MIVFITLMTILFAMLSIVPLLVDEAEINSNTIQPVWSSRLELFASEPFS